jgi:hypothetical protein
MQNGSAWLSCVGGIDDVAGGCELIARLSGWAAPLSVACHVAGGSVPPGSTTRQGGLRFWWMGTSPPMRRNACG